VNQKSHFGVQTFSVTGIPKFKQSIVFRSINRKLRFALISNHQLRSEEIRHILNVFQKSIRLRDPLDGLVFLMWNIAVLVSLEEGNITWNRNAI